MGGPTAPRPPYQQPEHHLREDAVERREVGARQLVQLHAEAAEQPLNHHRDQRQAREQPHAGAGHPREDTRRAAPQHRRQPRERDRGRAERDDDFRRRLLRLNDELVVERAEAGDEHHQPHERDPPRRPARVVAPRPDRQHDHRHPDGVRRDAVGVFEDELVILAETAPSRRRWRCGTRTTVPSATPGRPCRRRSSSPTARSRAARTSRGPRRRPRGAASGEPGGAGRSSVGSSGATSAGYGQLTDSNEPRPQGSGKAKPLPCGRG